jgi:translation initiation factor 2 subunit 2
MVDSPITDAKDTAVSHAPSTPPLSAALGAFTDASQAAAGDAAEGAADDGGLDMSLLKKKKKKPKKEEAEAEEADEGAAAGDDGGLDLSLKKKKKKKKAGEGEDAFAAKLAALDLKEGEEAEEGAADVDEGDMDKGTGIWGHDESTPPIPFNLLLRRFYKQLEERNPDHASSGSRNYKIPPPQCLREGNKKTIFANIVEISKRMKRSDEHVTQYLFAELGTTGSTDGSKRLVIRGRFQQKQIENVLRKYIIGGSRMSEFIVGLLSNFS